MAEDAANPENSGPIPNGEDTMPQVGLLTQYVKDLSFENPSAPDVFQWTGTEPPQIDVQFNINAEKRGEDMHEVNLKIEISGKVEQGTQFVVDLSYAGLFAIRNVDEQQIHPFLYAEAPRILFPFARRVIADAVRDGGFPPLLLEPIDFGGLYAQQLSQQVQGDEAGNIPVGQA